MSFPSPRIDTPRKLSRYLKDLAATTLTTSTHTRFNEDGDAVKSLKAPQAYHAFYEWTFGYTTGQSDELSLDIAIQLWSIVLEPYFEIAKDFVLFLRNHADRLELDRSVDRRAWVEALNFCLTVKLPAGENTATGLVGYTAEGREGAPLLREFAEWTENQRLEQ